MNTSCAAIVVVSAVAVALALPLDIGADATVTVVGGSACTQNAQCVDAAADSSGDVYAVNSSANQIEKFDANGNFIAAWGAYGTSPGQFQSPGGIAIDNSNNIYVSDDTRVQVFNSSGTYVRSFGSLLGGADSDVSVSPVGNVYVTSGSEMFEYNSAGSQIASWQFGSGGLPSSGFFAGITYDPENGDLYAVDQNASMVLQFDSSGTYVGSWGSPGSAAGQFSNPTGIAADDAGNIYVSEFGFGGIQEFTANGSYLGTFSQGALEEYLSISDGTLYATDGSGIVKVALGEPVAALSASSTAPETSQAVTFSASGSYLPFGSITDYKWDLTGSGSFSTDTGANPTVSTTLTQIGAATVSVEVTGSSGQTAISSTTVNVGPSLAAIVGPAEALTGQAVAFNASTSALADSTITDYRWDLADSGSFTTDTGTTPTISTTFSAPGVYKVGVQVTRSGGVTNTDYTSLTITPAPPPGNVGISIDNGDYASDSRSVDLHLVWPAGATSALVSNDGGFGASGGTKTISLAATVPWTLENTGTDRLTKTVYVRYLGAGINLVTFTDSIILDETVPTISAATLLPSTSSVKAQFGEQVVGREKVTLKHVYKLRVVASEKLSGIAAVESSPRKSGGVTSALKSVRAKGILKLDRIVSVTSSSIPRYVRVRSAAGKWSAWSAVKVGR
jgi:sugar lactone lactonase YvrE